MRNALCIEDDLVTASEIILELERAGFAVSHATDGAEGLALALGSDFDVITLDRMLPNVDGLEIISKLRAAGRDTPVLMISALSALDDRIQGIRAGGDDYLIKPFASEEMAVRVEALLRRHSRIEQATLLQVGDLSLHLIHRKLTCSANTIDLQPTEFKLVEFFMRNPNKVVTRGLIFEAVWGYSFDPGTKLIDVHLTRLRRKLEELNCNACIKTIRGSGFILESPAP
ncbi:response regulator transcription factor [Pseudomonas sp. NPDC089752]|uniref:response regulator transcription factor n=1 Tax=Pseudomonas sp. NPDC089752 TaxID=3364472 RepID=UPI0038217418